MKNAKLVFVLFFICISVYAKNLPEINFNLKTASVKTEDNKLIVSTDRLDHIWQLTNIGLVTIALKDLITGKVHKEKQVTQ